MHLLRSLTIAVLFQMNYMYISPHKKASFEGFEYFAVLFQMNYKYGFSMKVYTGHIDHRIDHFEVFEEQMISGLHWLHFEVWKFYLPKYLTI